MIQHFHSQVYAQEKGNKGLTQTLYMNIHKTLTIASKNINYIRINQTKDV